MHLLSSLFPGFSTTSSPLVVVASKSTWYGNWPGNPWLSSFGDFLWGDWEMGSMSHKYKQHNKEGEKRNVNIYSKVVVSETEPIFLGTETKQNSQFILFSKTRAWWIWLTWQPSPSYSPAYEAMHSLFPISWPKIEILKHQLCKIYIKNV